MIFQDAQGFVEIVDDEVGDAVAEGLLLRGAIGGCGERGRAGNVGGDEERAAGLVKLARVEQFAAETDLGIGLWVLDNVA